MPRPSRRRFMRAATSCRGWASRCRPAASARSTPRWVGLRMDSLSPDPPWAPEPAWGAAAPPLLTHSVPSAAPTARRRCDVLRVLCAGVPQPHVRQPDGRAAGQGRLARAAPHAHAGLRRCARGARRNPRRPAPHASRDEQTTTTPPRRPGLRRRGGTCTHAIRALCARPRCAPHRLQARELWGQRLTVALALDDLHDARQCIAALRVSATAPRRTPARSSAQ